MQRHLGIRDKKLHAAMRIHPKFTAEDVHETDAQNYPSVYRRKDHGFGLAR